LFQLDKNTNHNWQQFAFIWTCMEELPMPSCALKWDESSASRLTGLGLELKHTEEARRRPMHCSCSLPVLYNLMIF